MSRKFLFGGSLAILAFASAAFAAPATPAPEAEAAIAVDPAFHADVARAHAEARAAIRAAHVQIDAARHVAIDAVMPSHAEIAAAREEVRESVRAAHAEIVTAVRAQHIAAHAMVAAMRVAAAVPAVRPAPPAPPAPRAPRAVPAVPAVPAIAAPVLRSAPRNFNDARALDIEDVYGTLRVDVAPGPVTVTLTARKEVLDRVTMRVENGVLHVSEHSGIDGSWDIFRWLGYGDHGNLDRLDVAIRAPKGTALDVDGLVGAINVGDIEAPVKLDLAATSGTIGNVTRAKIEMAGSGKVRVTRVSGPLSVELAGGGSLITGPVGASDIEIAGSGSATLGAVSGGIHATIAGSGDLSAASINGAANVEIAGSGSVKIASGLATPLHLEIMGSGDFDFGGEAVNPNVEVLGSGKVRIKSYRGNLTTEGTSSVQIGSR